LGGKTGGALSFILRAHPRPDRPLSLRTFRVLPHVASRAKQEFLGAIGAGFAADPAFVSEGVGFDSRRVRAAADAEAGIVPACSVGTDGLP
jgi:hypothetical protein